MANNNIIEFHSFDVTKRQRFVNFVSASQYLI
jgi:hypothetical protein